VLSAHAATQSPTIVPTDLQTLVQRSQHLSVPSVILTAQDTVSRAGKMTARVAIDAKWRVSPPEVEAKSAGLGFSSDTRSLGDIVYWEPPGQITALIPGLRSRLHGRRWIRFTRTEFLKSQGASALPRFGPAAPNLVAPAGLAALVAVETNIVENGPTTVDGQPVTEFTGTANPSTLSHDFQDGFLDPDSPPSASVVLDIEPDGLLKRATITGATGGAQLALSADVISIASPVIVQRPSPTDTIDSDELTRAQLDDLSGS